MTGDFSRWQFDRFDNFSGVLPQQGRVLTDADGLAQTRISANWQETAARDTIGTGVAAVPAGEPDSFRVDEAKVVGTDVLLTVNPGHLWADGILTYLGASGPVSRTATYLEPPFEPVPGTIDPGVRDAVLLEVWRESVSAFQLPGKLLEPALGGPDTTERVLTAYDFRLFRMGAGDTCDTIFDRCQDDFSTKGKLTVTLAAPTVIPADCPLAAGGGYTGFEHNLYRIEIARTNAAAPMFKWSRFNGGLVGRGTFDAVNNLVNITANLQAITSSKLPRFYLEALAFDTASGRWNIVYGATATLNGTLLDLAAVATFQSIPGGQELFFRLWDDVRATSDFPIQLNPVELVDGIHLQFDPAAASNYTPGDYWTFAVRAGGLANDQTLIDAKPPEGIHYHRVPLAELDWNAAKDVTQAAGTIEDCRVTFQPLTRISTCCTYRVGDGLSSHGDFKSIQQAINHLPAAGGEVCVMPGTYTEAVVIDARKNIRVHGCGGRSIVVGLPGPKGGDALPVFTITNSTHIELDSLAIHADNLGIGVLIDGTRNPAPVLAAGTTLPTGNSTTRHITLARLEIAAAARPAIEVHEGQVLTIRECDIEMADVRTTWPAVFFQAEDGLIERNRIAVRSGRQVGPFEDMIVPASAATGGLQLAGTCARVRVVNNLIQGGIANGITLGSVVQIDLKGNRIPIFIGWIIDADDPCNPCKPGGVIWIDTPGKVITQSAGPLYDIVIERNRIGYMGLNGIGVIAFFDPKLSGETILVEGLSILGNRIHHCLLRPLANIAANMLNFSGFGGISLADVTDLTIWDNHIEDNGPNYLDPICGIFVLHGEGIDITRNQIRNNGSRTAEPASRAKAGRRGGINIVHALAPLKLGILGASKFPHPDGTPALKVHENIVSVPLGRALTLTAAGPVSIVANHFSSLGIEPKSNGLAIGAVQITNLGLPIELVGQLLTYSAIKQGDIGQATLNAPANTGDTVTVLTGTRAAPTSTSSRYLPDGSVLFANNHVLLDILDSAGNGFMTSIVILTLDDLGYQNNQCMANLLQGWLLTQALVFGLSCRVGGNRFEEPIFNALLSAMTLGGMNITSGNESTHCLLVYGWPGSVVKAPNLVFLDVLKKGICRSEPDYITGYGARATKVGGQ